MDYFDALYVVVWLICGDIGRRPCHRCKKKDRFWYLKNEYGNLTRPKLLTTDYAYKSTVPYPHLRLIVSWRSARMRFCYSYLNLS